MSLRLGLEGHDQLGLARGRRPPGVLRLACRRGGPGRGLGRRGFGPRVLAAARHAVLRKAGWDVEEKGLFGAPEIAVITSDESHISVFAALQMLGLGRSRQLRRVVLQQALRTIVPSYVNQLIGLIKDSSVLSIITVPELTMATQTVLGTTFAPVEAFSMVALIYWALTAAVAALMGVLEHHTPTRRAARQTAAFLAAADR